MAGETDVYRHFSRAGTRDKIGRAQAVEKFLLREPATAANELLFHHRNVGSRPAECRSPELQEN